MGIYLEGYFISSEYRKYEERTTLAVIIAVVVGENTNTYRVYLDERYSRDDLEVYNVGDKITLRARPYVGSNGKMGWSDGEIS